MLVTLMEQNVAIFGSVVLKLGIAHRHHFIFLHLIHSLRYFYNERTFHHFCLHALKFTRLN